MLYNARTQVRYQPNLSKLLIGCWTKLIHRILGTFLKEIELNFHCKRQWQWYDIIRCFEYFEVHRSSCIYFVTPHSQENPVVKWWKLLENTLPTMFRGFWLAHNMLEPSYGTNPFYQSFSLAVERNKLLNIRDVFV